MRTLKKLKAQEAAKKHKKPKDKKERSPFSFGKSVEELESSERWANAQAVDWDRALYRKRYGNGALVAMDKCREASRKGDMVALIGATFMFPTAVLG